MSSAAEDKWYADLALLAAAQKRSDHARRRATVLAVFVVFAFLLLSVRSQHNSSRINTNTNQIISTQRVSCESSREILRKYNRQQNTLADIEQHNKLVDSAVRAARIKAYLEARIDPLPICAPMPR